MNGPCLMGQSSSLSMSFDQLLDELEPVAREAGQLILDIHADGPEAEFKGDGSPVTAADQAAEAVILTALRECVPELPIVSEENAESHHLAAPDAFFLVDPLDGTREFLRPDGQGAFTVNIALIRSGTPVLGLVYAPALDRLFLGAEEFGAWELTKGGTVRSACRIRVLPDSGPVAVASRSHRDVQTDEWLLTHGIKDSVSIGSSLKFCLVAAGEADIYPRFGPTMEWDTAAGDAVLRAAGGRMVHPDGKAFRYGKPDYRNGAFLAIGGFVV